MNKNVVCCHIVFDGWPPEHSKTTELGLLCWRDAAEKEEKTERNGNQKHNLEEKCWVCPKKSCFLELSLLIDGVPSAAIAFWLYPSQKIESFCVCVCFFLGGVSPDNLQPCGCWFSAENIKKGKKRGGCLLFWSDKAKSKEQNFEKTKRKLNVWGFALSLGFAFIELLSGIPSV